MKTNLTPAKIVEMYLPDLDNKLVEFIKNFHDPQLGNPWFCFVNRYFSEALAERDRILCQKQRLLCEQHASTMLSDNGSIVINGDTIFNAPMPELKEE